MNLSIGMITVIKNNCFNWNTIELFELLVFNNSHIKFLRYNYIFQNM